MKIVNVNDRTIDVEALSGQIVAFDNTSYTIRFRIKKLYNEETDLSAYTWYLIFRNSEDQGDVVALTTEQDNDDTIFVDWQPGGLFTQVGGGCNLQLFAISGENKWHTEICYLVVKHGLTSSSDSPIAPSVLLTYLTTFQELKGDAEDSASAAAASALAAAQSEANALSYKQQADQDKAQTTTDRGAVASDKATVAADKAAALQALAEMRSLVMAAEANAAAASTPIAVIEGDQYSVGLVVSRGRVYLSAVPADD